METLLLERDSELPGLVTLTLNRPEKLNAINLTMHAEMQEACRQLQDDGEARVVILTGAGRAFSAGADLGRSPREPGAERAAPALPRSANQLEERLRSTAGNRSSAAIESLDQVTIGAINGLTIGGGVVWASCVDIRLAAESAWFSIPEVELNIPLTWNALPRLMREIGPARTKELVMACERFSADDALRWGFVNHVVPDSELLSRARALAARLLSMDPMALALTKSATNALAQLMVPAQATYNDRELLMLARLQAAERAAAKP
ncbi:MAG: enoyl-CoA hydratase/isomerase family protein [Chloroflexi bacterium]|nr:enoyl-CoA hydratase/isomerase family protein [Chloroflexota bacterium]